MNSLANLDTIRPHQGNFSADLSRYRGTRCWWRTGGPAEEMAQTHDPTFIIRVHHTLDFLNLMLWLAENLN